METSLECPICSETFDTTTRRPKVLDCGHTVCLADLLNIKRVNKELTCPFDSRKCRKQPESLPDNHSLLGLLDSAEIRCKEHDLIANRFCTGHLQPVCANCVHSSACEVKTLPLDLAEINHVLIDQISIRYDQVRLHTDETIESRVRRRYHNLLRDNLSLLQSLRDLIEQFDGLLCQVCAKPASLLMTNNLQSYCEGHATSGLSESYVVRVGGKSGEEICVELENLILRVLKRIDYYKLSKEQLFFLANRSKDAKEIQEFGKNLLSLVTYSKGTYDDIPILSHCPQCRSSLQKPTSRLLVLPCFDALHVVCQDCMQPLLESDMVVCPLDKSVFYMQGKSMKVVPELKAFPVRGAEGVPPFPLKPPPFPLKPLPKQRSPSEGSPLPPLNLPIEAHVLTRFSSVFPPIDIPSEQWLPTQRPWRQSRQLNQVEAVVFSCSEAVALVGVCLSVPIDPRQISVLDWVRLYRGVEGSGRTYTEVTAGKRLNGGNHILHPVLFPTPYPISACTMYTMKLKFLGDPDRDFDMYRGNPYDKPEIWLGSEGSLWEFEECVVVDESECLNGQNNISGPILQFLYTK